MLDTGYWRALDASPRCIHPDDQPFVDTHNALLTRSDGSPDQDHPHWIRTDRMAQPRLGPLTAPLVLLQLNPSFDDQPQDYARQYDDLLDPHSDHAGLRDGTNAWWTPKFKQLRALVTGPSSLSRKVCSIEYFPYASRRFGHAHLRLPSQQFQFALVREALRRNAVLIVTRGLNLWCGAVPELRQALGKQVFQTRNLRSAYVTETNLDDKAWERVVNAVNGG